MPIARSLSRLTIVALLSACGGGGGSSSPPSGNAAPPPATLSAGIAELESQGKLPRFIAGDSVQGTDANGNGVRDDLDEFLALQQFGAAELRAATQLAAGLRLAMVAPDGDMKAAREARVSMSAALACVYLNFTAPTGSRSAPAVVSLIEQASINTKARLEKYIKFNELFAGTVIKLSDELACA